MFGYCIQDAVSLSIKIMVSLLLRQRKSPCNVMRKKRRIYSRRGGCVFGLVAGRRGVRANGTILNRSPLHREWFHSFDVPYRKDPPPTFYQGYGCRLVPATLILAVGTLLTMGRRRRQGVF